MAGPLVDLHLVGHPPGLQQGLELKGFRHWDGLVAVAVAVTTRRPIGAFLWDSAPLSAIHSAGNSSIGLLAAWLAENAPLGLLALVVPMLLLWLSYDEQTARAAEARLFAELARLQERASGRSVDVSAQVVLTAAARLFGGADVEMVLMTADGAAHYVGDETGVSRRRVDPGVLDSGWVIRALGGVPEYFAVDSFHVSVERKVVAPGVTYSASQAVVKIRIGEDRLISAAEGNGPVNALDLALRKDLGVYQKYIEDLELRDYRGRVFQGGTDAVTRVLIEFGDGNGGAWSTVGVSGNIIDASFQALVDAITYRLIKVGVAAQ